MEKPKLPIHEISTDDFSKFSRRYLNTSKSLSLSKEAIEEIKKLFSLGEKGIASFNCNEYHAHSFECFYYKSPEAGIVERLINERNYYRKIIRDINKKTEL